MVLEKAAHVSDLFRGSNRSVGSPQKNYQDSDCEHHLLNNLSRWGLVLKHTQKKMHTACPAKFKSLKP